ncbi:hypothetical protein ACQEVC_31075 [Plantactinospora sp. CA-294935]|uniref:hypothetical protein n=1 Tax=Plantactinospora sp. CA-294935 TaxID=3240012 RepID=UPI003D91A280
MLYVRHGKAMKGSPPKRGSVLTAWSWAPEILAEWVKDIRPLLAVEGDSASRPLPAASPHYANSYFKHRPPVVAQAAGFHHATERHHAGSRSGPRGR